MAGEIATESHDVMEEYEWWDRVNAVWTAEKAHADILEGYVIKDFRNFGALLQQLQHGLCAVNHYGRLGELQLRWHT